MQIVKNTDQRIKTSPAEISSQEFELVIEPTRSILFDWKEIFRYRELFYFFTWRDIKIKYKQTVLGFAWAILQPLLLMIIFTVVFSRAFQLPTSKLPYPVFVFSGLLIWILFSSGVTSAANSMVNNSTIIKKVYFPRLVIPVSSVLVALFDFVMALALYIVVLIYYSQPLSWTAVLYWPLGIVITCLATIGLGSLLAALNVKYRDVRYAIPFLIQVLFFITPVMYSTSVFEQDWIKYMVAASPMYAAIEIFRLPLTGTLENPSLITVSLTSCVVLFGAGIIYFRRTEDFFADLA